MRPTTYDTMVEATNELQKRGFTDEFKMEDDKMVSLKTDASYTPEEMEVVEFYRFEGDSDPADMCIVYAVQCGDDSQGIIVAPYGVNANTRLDKFMKKVKIPDREHAAGPIHSVEK